MSVDAQQISGGVIKGLQLRDTWTVTKALATERRGVCVCRGCGLTVAWGSAHLPPFWCFLVDHGRIVEADMKSPGAALPQEEHWDLLSVIQKDLSLVN